MDSAKPQQAQVRFTEPSYGTHMEAGSADPAHESSASGSHEAGWLSKPIVRDLLEHEQAIAIQTVFMPHLSSIENEVSGQSIHAEAQWKVAILVAINEQC